MAVSSRWLMTDTCINYQTIMPPIFGEHLAFGDTGSVIYANSVLGALQWWQRTRPYPATAQCHG